MSKTKDLETSTTSIILRYYGDESEPPLAKLILEACKEAGLVFQVMRPASSWDTGFWIEQIEVE